MEQPIETSLLLAILDASRLQIRTTGYTLARINGVEPAVQARLIECNSKLEAFDAMITMLIAELKEARP